MRSLRNALAAVAAMACLSLPTAAKADPIGPNCGSCFGNIFELSYLTLSPAHFRITLEIDTANTTLSATQYIAQVAFKPVSSSSDIISALLVSTTAPGAFGQPTLGGLNNGGCTTGSQGFVCSTGSAPFAFTDGSTYAWLFDITVTDSSQWLLADLAASVKVNYGPDNGLLTSENITLQNGCCVPPPPPPPPLPEPNTLALAGLGIGLVALARRRKYQV